MSTLLTTREAAQLLGVGTTSIKRWADTGTIRCIKTPGGHRRFPLDAVEAMLDVARSEPEEAAYAAAWVNMLVRGTSPHEVHRRLTDEREQLGAWWRVGEQLGPVIEEIGLQWERGQITVLQEHLASERLARGLARCAESIAPRLNAPRALLVTAEGDEHTLGLSLVEPCLREAGWICRWAGRDAPRSSVQTFVESREVQLVALSASRYSADRSKLVEQADWYSSLCRPHRVGLLLGGRGRWPDPPTYGHRIRTFGELADVVGELGQR